jgi:hypothetical protein
MRALPQWFGHKEAQRQIAELVGDSDARSISANDRLAFMLGGYSWRIAWRPSAATRPLQDAVRELQEAPKPRSKRHIPLVVVPYMGEAGRDICKRSAVSWLDLAGNADIAAPGLRARLEGRPNPFKRDRNDAAVFAPKSSRIARWLLVNYPTPVRQRELAHLTGMDEGLTSRLVAALRDARFVKRDDEGRIAVIEPDPLLDAWEGAYDFGKHYVLRGHVAARSSEEVLRRLSAAFGADTFALTGLAAAWQYTRHAAYRVTSVYLREPPDAQVLSALGFRQTDEGANLWLIVPNDEGVFQGAVRFDDDDLTCVSRVQTYLDLAAHPERAKEAAEELRKTLFLEPQAQAVAPTVVTRRKAKHGR